MESKDYALTVDLVKPSYYNTPTMRYNDENVLTLTVLNSGLPADLSAVTTTSLAVTRSDKAVVVVSGTLVDNVATFTLNGSELAKPGRCKVTAQFYDADSRISTVDFDIVSIADPTANGYVPSENEQTLIETVLNDGPLRIQEAIDAAEYANEQGDYALQVADENKTTYLPAVETVALRDSNYPTPSHGDTVRVTATSTTYRYQNGEGWVITDIYNPTAIDEVTAQLAEIANVFVVVKGLIKDTVVDNSQIINDVIDSLPNGGTVFVPEGTYYIDTVKRVKLKSNIRLVLHPNTILKAIPSDTGTTSAVEGAVVQIYYVDNVQVINGTIEGDVLTHPSSEGQWNHGVKIFNSTNVYFENVKSNRHLGDGFYLDHGYSSNVQNENIIFNNCFADGNNRNGFSILVGKNVKLINPIAINHLGINPGAGIDIEIAEYTLHPIAENIIVQNPTTKNNLVGITGRWDGCDGQDVTITIENHYDDSSYRSVSFYNNVDVAIGGEVKVISPRWLNAKSNAFVTEKYRSTNARVVIQNPFVKNSNTSGDTLLQGGSCFYLIGHASTCGNVGIYNPTIEDDRGTPMITTILHAMDGGSFEKLEFHNPVSLPQTIQRPLFVKGNLSIKDERELLKYSSTWYEVMMDNSYLAPINTNEQMVTYGYIRYFLQSTAPIGREFEFRVINNKVLYVKPPAGHAILPLAAVDKEIYSSIIGNSIRLKKIDSTTWVVTKIIGTWTVQA